MYRKSARKFIKSSTYKRKLEYFQAGPVPGACHDIMEAKGSYYLVN